MSWQPKRLDQLGAVSRGRSRHRPRDAAHLYGGPHPFIQTGDVKHAGLYINDYTQTYSDAGLAQSKLWPVGTLCITIAANIADTAILGIDACFPDSVIGFTPDPHEADARFVKYLFDAIIKHRAQKFSQGAAQDNLSQEKLLSLEFDVPKVDEQKRIADVLAAYDDLIENNQRRMALLEESARLLYSEWFVRLRFPGHEHTRITDGMPEGWERKTLGDVAHINQTNLGSTYDGEIEYIDIASVTPGAINETTPYDFRDAPSRARRVVCHGDIIWSCVRPNRRSHAVVWQPPENLVASTGFAVITPISLPTSFLYQAVTTDLFVGYLENHAKGAAYPAVVAGDFERAKILVPSPVLSNAFNEFAEPLLTETHNLRVQNQKLRATRDLLLPRLMSGELLA
ncbi:MAG: restriction endonuclease subunit S [Pseudomonadota bacterium]